MWVDRNYEPCHESMAHKFIGNLNLIGRKQAGLPKPGWADRDGCAAVRAPAHALGAPRL